jgi:hypothetical protein
MQAHAREEFWLRAGLLLLLCSFAALTRHSLDSVEAVVGAACCVLSSLLLPTFFYVGIRLKKGRVSCTLWAAAAFIVVFGTALMTLILGETVKKITGDMLNLSEFLGF